MEVFVWKWYGEINIYDVSNFEKAKSVVQNILDCMGNWGEQDEDFVSMLKYAEGVLAESTTSQQLRGLINYLLHSGWIEDTDQFQSGTGIYRVE